MSDHFKVLVNILSCDISEDEMRSMLASYLSDLTLEDHKILFYALATNEFVVHRLFGRIGCDPKLLDVSLEELKIMIGGDLR